MDINNTQVCASFEALVDQLSDSDKQLIHPTSGGLGSVLNT